MVRTHPGPDVTVELAQEQGPREGLSAERLQAGGDLINGAGHRADGTHCGLCQTR